MDNEINGYSLFTEVKEPLRSFNRCAITANLMENSREQAEEYLSQLSELEKAQCMAMALSIKEFGVDAVKKKIAAEYTFEEDV